MSRSSERQTVHFFESWMRPQKLRNCGAVRDAVENVGPAPLGVRICFTAKFCWPLQVVTILNESRMPRRLG
jgi:hypothetical protein